MKPIEPGCLAVVIGGMGAIENVGKVCTCIRFIGSQEEHINTDLWEVDRPMVFVDYTGGSPIYVPLAPEKYLMRIDGYEDSEATEQSQPKQLEALPA